MAVTVPGNSAVWIQGATIPANGSLVLVADNMVFWNPGSSNAGGEATIGSGGNLSALPADSLLVDPYGCAVLFLPVGTSPDNAHHYTSNVMGFGLTSPTSLTPVRVSYTYAQIVAACDPGNAGPWVVWYRPNDDSPLNNTGSWTIREAVRFPMARYIFSTGLYVASLPLPLPTITRQVKGAPAAAAQPLSNLADSDVTTLVDLPITDANNFRYLSLDYGASQTIGRVSVYNVALTGAGATLKCYASATPIASGDFSGAIAIPASITPSGAANDWEFQPAAGYGNSVAGRYLYIVPATGATGCTIGDIDARSTEYVLAAMQNIAVNLKFQLKTLKESATVTMYPIADAMYGGSVEVQPEFADLNEIGIQLFTGAQITTVSTTHVITPGATTKPLPFVGELITMGTAGRPFRIITYHTVAPGFSWSLKSEDFATQKFSAMCRVPNAVSANVGRVWRIIAGQ